MDYVASNASFVIAYAYFIIKIDNSELGGYSDSNAIIIVKSPITPSSELSISILT